MHIRAHTPTHKIKTCASSVPSFPLPTCTSPMPSHSPPTYAFSLHTTLIINDLRDSFHLIYYLGRDGGCCAAASLLDL